VQARVFIGRCLPYGEGITYWPLQEIVSQIEDVRDALASSSDAELATIRIEAALGLTDTPVSPEEIAWGARRLFEALAARGPLVVVFDDIHWAEATFLDLIEYVAAFAQDVPLLLLCTARPDLFELRPTWTTPKPNSTLVTLQALSESDSEALVAQLVDLPVETRERIVQAAEGNPLFVEQLTAMQAENGDAIEVPPTLQALLAARIDRLGDEERAAAQRGSVEGRLFHRGVVAALLPEPERPEVGAHLLSLVRKELIRPDRATLPGDDAFRFGHILIRDAAYDAIPKRQRAGLHEQFATWLEARLGDGAPDEVVGYHLGQAYFYGVELGSVDPSVGERAAARLQSAAQAAMGRQDVAAAVNLLGRAVELVPDGADRPLLLIRLGEALDEASELERAKTSFEEGVTLARAAGDEHAEWLGRMWLTRIRLLQDPEGALEPMLEEAAAAVAAREPAEDHEVLAAAWGRIATAHYWRGETGESRDALKRALDHARRSGSLALEVSLMGSKAPDFVWGPGRVEDGMAYAEELVERLGHVPGVQQFALHLRAHMQARLGQFTGALEALATYRSNLRELGKEREYANTANCVWDVCTWSGDLEHGEEVLREAYEFLERRGNKAFLSNTAIQLGNAVVRQGRLEEAERFCELGEELTASEDVENEAGLALLRARILAARRDLVRAEEEARRAVEIASGTEALELAADAWLTLAKVLRTNGDASDTAAASEALALYERKGNVVGAGWAQAFLDEGQSDYAGAGRCTSGSSSPRADAIASSRVSFESFSHAASRRRQRAPLPPRRRRGRARGAGRARLSARDDRVHRRVPTAECERPRLEPGPVEPRCFDGDAADQHLARACRRGKTGSGVHGIADRGEVVVVALADAADVRHPGVDAGADRHPWLVAVVPRLTHELLSRPDGTACMVVAGEAWNEQGHDLVSYELIDEPVPALDRASRRTVEARDEPRELLRGHPLGESRGTAHIGEEQRELDLCAARFAVDLLEAAPAEALVERRRPEAERSQNQASRCLHRRETELAARSGRDPADELPPPCEPFHVAREDPAPDLGRLRVALSLLEAPHTLGVLVRLVGHRTHIIVHWWNAASQAAAPSALQPSCA
jgi:tetratricopeptide (TPR) repeat protein